MDFEFVRAPGVQGLGRHHHEESVAVAHRVAARARALQHLGGASIHGGPAYGHGVGQIEPHRRLALHRGSRLHARDRIQREIGIHGGFDAVIAQLEIGPRRDLAAARRPAWEVGPIIEGQRIIAAGNLSGGNLVGRVRVVQQVEIAEPKLVEHGHEEAGLSRRAVQEVQHQARLVAFREGVQYRGPLLVQRRADLGSLAIGRVAGKLRDQGIVLAACKEEHRRAEVLVQVRRSSEFGQRAALSPVRRQQDRLAIATIDVGGEDGRDAAPGHRFGENQVAVVEINADVFADQRQVADAVALLSIEAVLPQGARQIGRRGAPKRPTGQDRDSRHPAMHNPSLPGSQWLQRGPGSHLETLLSTLRGQD